MTEAQRAAMKLSDEILGIIDATDMPRGDVQGAVEAIAMKWLTSPTVLYCPDLGCVYRISEGAIEWAPLIEGHIFDPDEFGPVEEDLVGQETVTFQGVDTTLSTVFWWVRQTLA